jgi:hypothetical protein
MDPQRESDLFYSRAAKAGDEFRKNTLSFSVGALGVFFISLTGEEAPNLSGAERIVLLFALVAFALATLSGLLAWLFAGRYFHDRAQAATSTADPQRTQAGTNTKDPFHFHKSFFDIALVSLFGVGVIASAVYLWMATTGWPENSLP